MKGKRNLTRLSVLVLTMFVLSLFTGFVSLWPEAEAAQPQLVITGTGVKQDVEVTNWNKYNLEEKHFSSNNSVNIHKIVKVKGYNLWDIIGRDNLKDDQDYVITFESSDGFKTTKKVSELKTTYTYPDFTEDSKKIIGPMLGFYQRELIEVLPDNFTPPISCEDQELTESDIDNSAPRLVFGQQDIDDKNQSKWAKKVIKITVGEERPVEQPVISFSGSGFQKDVKFTTEELKNLSAKYQINESYQYNSKGGAKSTDVKGVNLWYVLNELVGIKDTGALVQFVTGDGYLVDPQSQQDIASAQLQYVLAYEVDGKPVNDGGAKLRIYRHQKVEGEFNTVFKAIVGIRLDASGGGDPGEIDFTNSSYKHISYDGAPYNVDSITGATLTIEGPGLKDYRAISVRQLEEQKNGLHRGIYAELIAGKERKNSYEGITVRHLLDNFVVLKEHAGKVVFKDKSRQNIGEYTQDEIDNLNMIVAYGINEVPLVYLDSDVGYVPGKYNDDGCLKLVYNHNKAREFSNVAYIYVTEADAPGVYEHSLSPYNDPRYTNYLLTITGAGLGKETNYTVKDIEAMTNIQEEKEYSLSNSQYYWYYNTYKGVKLWDLLLDAGLDPNIDEGTKVQFIAADNYNFQPLTIKDIKNDHLYGYYEKDATDLGDGKFDGSNVEPLQTGYPVLLAYGFNGYPYVIRPSDPGFNSGLGNDGGPLRVIFGKKSYADNNGSNQVQFVKKIIIGEPENYATHSYPPYDSLDNSPLSIRVMGENNTIIKEQNFTVKELENMVYNVPATEADKARMKDHYFIKVHNDNKISDLFEGVNLWYLLTEKVGLTGTIGTVLFKDGAGQAVTVPLEAIKDSSYFNEVTGVQGIKPVLAYAKNGYPMVKDKNDGYISSGKNNGGPLMVVFGQSTPGVPGLTLENVQEIIIDIQQDKWAHLAPPYDVYATNELKISGNGARKQATITVQDLEALQNYIFTDKYSLLNSKGNTVENEYKGIDLYQYLTKEVGLKATATGVKVIAADGFSKIFTLEELAKNNYQNSVSGVNNLKVMLAYGGNEKPLVPDKDSVGYDETAKNSGGPLRLIIGQKDAKDVNNSNCIGNVTEIVIEGESGESWKHDFGQYVQYQDQPVLRITGSQIKNPRTFTLKELEALDEYIVRHTYTGDGTQELEGIVLWDLINNVVGLKDGVTVPNITVYSGPGYNRTLQNIDQVKNGVVNSNGERKDIILAYAQNGYPLVPSASSPGYENNNQHGPLRLILEENKSMWIKNTDCIVVGDGNYEEPEKELEEPGQLQPGTRDWTLYRNDNNSGLPLASIRSVTPDDKNGFWVGTYGGGVAYKDDQGNWTVYNKNNSQLPDNTVYDVAIDAKGKVWIANGGAETPKGIVLKDGDIWTVYNTENSGLPNNFVHTISPDSKGGLWFGTGNGAAYLDKNGNWTSYGKNDGLPATSVNQIVPDNKGGVWFGCYPDTVGEGKYLGGYAYRDATGKWTVYRDENNYNFGDNWVRSISLDQYGGVWVTRSGNYEGGGKVDYVSAKGKKETIDNKELYPTMPEGDTIRLIAVDQDGGLWLGTKLSGLLYRDVEDRLFVYNSNNGWPKGTWNDIYFLELDQNGGVWVGTNGGVAHLPDNTAEEPEDPSAPGGDVPGKEVVLTVDGSGVAKTYKFSLAELKRGQIVKEEYFSINNYGTKSYTSFEGISLAYLLGKMIDSKNSAESVRITASDGYYRQYNISDVKKNYIDENNPNKSLPMILAWKEDGEDIPLKLVIGQTKVGDVNKPNWVSNVENITINTSRVVSGSGSASRYSSDEELTSGVAEKILDISKNTEISKISIKDGRIAERIKVLESAGDVIKEEKSTTIQLTSEGKTDVLVVEIPYSVWQTAMGIDINFEAGNKMGTYFLPADAFDLVQLGKEMGTAERNINVVVTIAKTTDEQTNNLTASVGQGQNIVANPVEFKIELVAMDKRKEITSFNRYVERKLPLIETVKANEMTGVVWNERDNAFTSVPTKFVKGKDGKTYAVMLSRTNSIYSVLKHHKAFTDTNDSWAKQDIELLASKMVIFGKDDTTYQPTAKITRAEFATLLVRAMNINETKPEKVVFKDISDGDWYVKGVTAAVREGIVNGYNDGTFKPDQNITRQEMAAMLVRAMETAGKQVSISEQEIDKELAAFTDEAAISDWVKRDVAYVKQAGIIVGLPGGEFAPQQLADRAQTATILKRFLQHIDFISVD